MDGEDGRDGAIEDQNEVFYIYLIKPSKIVKLQNKRSRRRRTTTISDS